MTTAPRIFVLLGAYEDLTERESSALRRGDIEHAITIENRKQRLAVSLAEVRRNTVLSDGELDVLNRRVRMLEDHEMANLAFLREELARVGASLGALKKAVHRSRQVRRGYVAAHAPISALANGILGRA